MTALKALYYPSTDISNPDVIKSALLLWDKIETIVPRVPWNPRRRADSISFNEAVDLIVEPRVPSEAERWQAEEELRNLVQAGLPQSLAEQDPAAWRGREQFIYPDKFTQNTWQMFEDAGHARRNAATSDYRVSGTIGFLMMSVLADACAGTQIQRVTDRTDAYGWIAEHHAHLMGESHVMRSAGKDASNHDRLVTMALETVSGQHLPLRSLVAMRKRELRSGGSDYAAMRRRLSKALQDHLKRIGEEARTVSDIRELERTFKNELRTDLSDLKAELRLASRKALFSKEVAISLLVLAGCLTSLGFGALPPGAETVGVIPLAKAAVTFRGARREALRRHDMSWLFLANR